MLDPAAILFLKKHWTTLPTSWAIRAPAPHCFVVLSARGHSRVFPAPVRPVRHLSVCFAIVSEVLLL